MTNEEYDRLMKEAKEKYHKACKEIRVDYVKWNTTIGVGDAVKDHIGMVLVEKAGVNIPVTGYPEPKFYGLCLRKDGVPRKDQSKRWIYGCNII